MGSTAAIHLLACLFRERREYRHRAGATPDGDREARCHEIGKRIIEVVGKPPEDDVGVLSAEAGSEPPDVWPDDRRTRTHR